MARDRSLIGQKFNRLTVVDVSDNGSNSHTYWLCECDCGAIKDVSEYAFTSGSTKSCGCYNLESKSKYHEATYHGMGGHPLYGVWKKMRSRITNPNNPSYQNYGGRGLTMDESWIESPKPFIDWSESNGWYEGCNLSIDRIDNDRGYYPDNCKISNRTEQNINQRIQKNNTSGYKGVHLNKRSGKWVSRISVDKKRIPLGSYSNIEDAVKARQAGEIKYFGRILHPEQTLLSSEEIEHLADSTEGS